MSIALEDEQRVLSEASHDLANRFHRTYYFLDLLEDSVHEGSREQFQRLKETVEDLESIARRTLQFVRPVELRTIRVRLEDLVASLRQHAGLAGLAVAGAPEAGRLEVAVDPTRIAETLAAIGRSVTGGSSSEEPGRVEVLGGNPAGLRIGRDGEAPAGPLPHLELALAARVVRLHGGSLEIDQTADGRAPSFTLRLPVANPGT